MKLLIVLGLLFLFNPLNWKKIVSSPDLIVTELFTSKSGKTCSMDYDCDIKQICSFDKVCKEPSHDYME